ncbi:family S53 protease-like protein [Mycena floridula]|nr:family S53 protease-like protein [Mycena floridula]
MFSVFCFNLLLASAALATPTRRATTVHELRQSVPKAFANKGPASPDTTVDLRIGLTPSDRTGLIKALYDVSTPGSCLYGQHLSAGQVNSLRAPTPETLSAVTSWLSSNGVTNITNNNDSWLSFSIPVSQANSLLDANFEEYVHTESGVASIRTLGYSIPADLQNHIDVVHPTTSFVPPLTSGHSPTFVTSFVPSTNVNGTNGTAPDSCATTITPDCIFDLYGVPQDAASQSSNTSNASSTNIIAVTGFINQFAQQSDLQAFLTKFRPDISSDTTFDQQSVDGGQNPQDSSQAGVEANLDIQYTVGIATGVPVLFVSVGDTSNDGAAGFLDAMNFLVGLDSIPPQVTTSYGFNEGDLSPSVQAKLCDTYAAIGARGTSVLFASGDGGVSGTQTQDCTTFQPTFPASCPFLTAVGSTTGISPEVAADFSSGGFSNAFGVPDYQSEAVSAYLSTLGDTNSGLFNSSGRGIPDVSTQGQNVAIVNSGQTGNVAGTSCSSPMFASIVALINDRLISNGKSPLGFLNPFLYGHPEMFTDVTKGSNPGCSTQGFPAASGWDPVTGLGTPLFDKMLTAAGL